MKERLGDSVVRCVGYGHVGDGNMHLNITTKEYDDKVMNLIEPFLYEWTSKQKGSISAEHGTKRFLYFYTNWVNLKSGRFVSGLGFKKRNFMHFSKSPSAINTMKKLKTVFDPSGIMNPYKVLPDN